MLLQADARAMPLVDGCVDCVVTSPPYFGLRDYGVRGQIGLESTPEAFVAALVAVFREVRRVLKDRGTVWLNLGDSYALGVGTARGLPYKRHVPQTSGLWKGTRSEKRDLGNSGQIKDCGAAKPKDLLGIPWRVAFALQADGWYLRSDIIWSKPNPMPESVTDRPTKAHEYVFLLTKSEQYFYDAAAIAEPVSSAMLQEMAQGYDGLGLKDYAAAGVQNPSSVKARIIANARNRNKGVVLDESGARHGDGARWNIADGGGFPRNGITRNRRTVWTVTAQPYAGAHFATMPEALVEPCILAGCPMGGLVLDPFSGSGTVGVVAERLGRRWVGVDLHPGYHALAKTRTAQRGLRFEAGVA